MGKEGRYGLHEFSLILTGENRGRGDEVSMQFYYPFSGSTVQRFSDSSFELPSSFGLRHSSFPHQALRLSDRPFELLRPSIRPVNLRHATEIAEQAVGRDFAGEWA